MKKFTLVAALMVLLCGTALSAKDFKWSESWCNYGAGIEKGDFLINVDFGLDAADLGTVIACNSFSYYKNVWMLPPIFAEVQYATPIWKLPFTFGGFIGMHGYGYNYDSNYWYYNRTPAWEKNTYLALFIGGEAAYHAKLPIEKLDVYAMIRLGANIPVSKPKYGIYTPQYVIGGFQLGANWFFTDKFAANLEVGYPFNKIGLTVKL